MSVDGLDPRLTFDNFVVGPGNRLAAAAARRVAEAPGKAYNPLFVYSASGLGKTHLLMAIGNHARRVQSALRVVCGALDRVIATAPMPGLAAAGRTPLDDAQAVLLDDAQVLSGDRHAQEVLLAWWDVLIARGTQIVLAADRPPSEIDHVDHRLASRLCSGLIADIGPPDYESRVALVRRKAEERGHALAEGVPESIARVTFSNVRELQGGLNRVIAAQELDGRPVSAEEIASLLGLAPEPRESEEFDEFFTEVAGAVAEIATRVTPEQRIVDAILRFEGEGFRTYRLEQALREPPTEAAAVDLVDRFAADVERLMSIVREIRALDVDAPELARTDLLRNPDRVLEAEALVQQVHERLRPLPAPPPGRGFEESPLADGSPALVAAREVARQPGGRFNPLYVAGPNGSGKTALLAALAQHVRASQPMLPVAFVEAPALAIELEEAMRRGHEESWRARYRRARLLVVDDIDRVHVDEPVRDGLYYLFDGVRRSGGQLVFAGQTEPERIEGPSDRLHAFLAAAVTRRIAATDLDGGATPPTHDEPAPAAGEIADPWFHDREKVLVSWPYIEDLLETELE